jgi:glycosyltransferase involved in cell wall biosynthesis
MACGLPVVATDVPGSREVLGNDVEAQLCRMSDPVDLAQKLGDLFCSQKQREHYGAKNRERVMSEFSIDTMREKMCSVIIKTFNSQKKMC